MNLTIAGTGYVGLVAGVCFAHVGHNVTCVDIDEKKVELLRSGVSPIYEEGLEDFLKEGLSSNLLHFTTDYTSAYAGADVIFIGVGTPELADGSANLTYVATVARQIAESVTHDCLVVVKSTVPVGTNDKVEQFIKDSLVNKVCVEVASNPEFLAQGTAVHDMMHAARIIIGVESSHAESVLRTVYAPFNLPIVTVKRRSAEMSKYAANDFLALKISYMNDLANLCELVGADIEDVAKGMAYDDRIGARYLRAGIGYGGSCFPKDTKALEYLAKQHGYKLQTVAAAVSVNTSQRTVLYKKACNRMITFNGIKVAVLGLAFKAGTDDLRESPALYNIPLLLEQGAVITAFDPIAEANCRKQYDFSMQYAPTVSEALKDAQVCFIFTDWKEIRSTAPSAFKQLMRTPLVYDGRNLFDPVAMKTAGVEYYSIGR
ncbi:UDP-glucose/GDP-mannose dehydrogenase family protein [uncultured Sphaerochaeta sp.]|uniref:UDP-glucose dehydrogenase family protein n=1 Tax=uncultured Sphaerochaeta sp. TaxID=886478 RepID=UPI002A0A1988|nr:UDP-glucose/GDP-mannose dehydrogenase family protein [uncultured Sphaerochaeta sp.]